MNKANRFNLLLKDTTSTKNVDRISNNNNNQINRFVSKQVNDERNKKKQTDNFIKSLDSLTEFPELQMKKKESIVLNNNNNKSTFMDAIKTNNLINEINSIESQNEENVPLGCVCIKIDKTTNSHNWIYGENDSKNNYGDEVVIEENPYFVFQRVVDLYNNRKNEYIRKWGIEDYERTYMFQNYDYEYFDKLDDEQYSKKF